MIKQHKHLLRGGISHAAMATNMPLHDDRVIRIWLARMVEAIDEQIAVLMQTAS